jgi:hypothetical protein
MSLRTPAKDYGGAGRNRNRAQNAATILHAMNTATFDESAGHVVPVGMNSTPYAPAVILCL